MKSFNLDTAGRKFHLALLAIILLTLSFWSRFLFGFDLLNGTQYASALVSIVGIYQGVNVAQKVFSAEGITNEPTDTPQQSS